MKNIYIKFKEFIKSETILEYSYFKLTVSNNIIFIMILLVIVKLFWFIVNM